MQPSSADTLSVAHSLPAAQLAAVFKPASKAVAKEVKQEVPFRSGTEGRNGHLQVAYLLLAQTWWPAVAGQAAPAGKKKKSLRPCGDYQAAGSSVLHRVCVCVCVWACSGALWKGNTSDSPRAKISLTCALLGFQRDISRRCSNKTLRWWCRVNPPCHLSHGSGLSLQYYDPRLFFFLFNSSQTSCKTVITAQDKLQPVSVLRGTV